ncbi:MAG: hypothetical protein AAF846_19605 [Chloroflexota bacterium]
MRRLTIQRTSLIIIFVLIFTMAIRVPFDMDTWWHLRSGEYILDNGTIMGDPFSHTANGETWINHSWGSQIVMSLIWQGAGNVGLALYTALLATGGMALLYQVSAGNVYLRGFILILGSATAALFWSARPQMLSFFFTTVILWLVYSYKRHDRDYLWAIIPLMWVWANLHAGWAIGYLFLIAFIVGEVFNHVFGADDGYQMSWSGWRKLTAFTIISIPFLAISPYDIDNLLVPFNTVGIEPLQAFIQEWQPPNFQARETYPFIATMMLCFFAFWISKIKFDWSSFFLLIGTLFLALSYSRNIAVFAVVAVPILSYHLDNVLTERGYVLHPRERVPQRMAMINLALLIVVISGALLYTIGLLLPDNVDEVQRQHLPIGAVAYLNEHQLSGEMFNSYNWGGYLMFATEDYPVFVDGRTDLYGDFVFDYAQIYLNQVDDLAIELATYDIGFVIVEANAPIIGGLDNLDGWSEVYRDDLAVIWSNNNE